MITSFRARAFATERSFSLTPTGTESKKGATSTTHVLNRGPHGVVSPLIHRGPAKCKALVCKWLKYRPLPLILQCRSVVFMSTQTGTSLIEAVIVVSKEGVGRKSILKSKRKRGKINKIPSHTSPILRNGYALSFGFITLKNKAPNPIH